MYLVAFIGVMCSVIGAFYYLRFIKIMYFEKLTNWVSFNQVSREGSIILGLSFLFIIGFFLNPSLLLTLTHKIALLLVI